MRERIERELFMGADIRDKRNFEARQAWASKVVKTHINNSRLTNVIGNEELLVSKIRALVKLLKVSEVNCLLEDDIKVYAHSLVQNLSTTLSVSNQQKLFS